MSVEKLSKKLAAVNGRKLFSLQVSVAQLVSIGQLYCKLVVKGTPCIHFHGNMVHWCHTLPWNSTMMSCNIQRHHCDVIYITVLYSACWNILYDIHGGYTFFKDIGCAADHTLLDFPSTYYRFHVCKHDMQCACMCKDQWSFILVCTCTAVWLWPPLQ